MKSAHLTGCTFAIACILLLAAPLANAQVTRTVDPSAAWVGFVNVFELPENGGAYVFGSPWGTNDLTATFAGPVLTLTPTPIGDPDPFWYQGGGGPGAAGNKHMEAIMYVEETGPLSGQLVTFTGLGLSNSLVSPYTSVAFIRDFAPDYSSFTEVTAPLSPGVFSISLATNPAPGRHVQYGFLTAGPNVWPTDLASKGSVQVTLIPEPSSMVLLMVAAVFASRRYSRGASCEARSR